MEGSPFEHVGITNDSSNLRIAIATLGALVDIRTTNDSQPIVHYTDLFTPVNTDLGSTDD